MAVGTNFKKLLSVSTTNFYTIQKSYYKWNIESYKSTQQIPVEYTDYFSAEG